MILEICDETRTLEIYDRYSQHWRFMIDTLGIGDL